ncbi:MAG: hypothetical protein ACLPIC_13815 [Rhodoblastus sp.]|uniref:hypothetical protein n=1 Tax=Rhodoblastus sp. TaxID=1962975 RepID=UPI003F96826A
MVDVDALDLVEVHFDGVTRDKAVFADQAMVGHGDDRRHSANPAEETGYDGERDQEKCDDEFFAVEVLGQRKTRDEQCEHEDSVAIDEPMPPRFETDGFVGGKQRIHVFHCRFNSAVGSALSSIG